MFTEYEKTLCNLCLGCNKLEIKGFRGVTNCNEYRNCNSETKTDTKGETKWNYKQLKLKT